MKKTLILLALAVMLLFVGCSQTGIDIGNTQPPATPDAAQGDTPQATPEETPKPTPEDTPQATPAAEQTPGSALTEDDFRIVVDGVTIAIGADPAPVFDAFGDGGANEENDYGLLGWTDASHTHKFYRHDYEGFYIFVNTDVETETSEISLIGLSGIDTSRGIGTGDSYEAMRAQYGAPDKENSDEGMMDCTYQSGEREIVIILNESDSVIILIEMQKK